MYEDIKKFLKGRDEHFLEELDKIQMSSSPNASPKDL